jgi:hypothetical protein
MNDGDVPAEPYRSPAKLAKVLVWALVAITAANAISIALSLSYASVVHAALGDGVTLAKADAAEDRFGIAGILILITFVPAIITFILWFRRAYRNVPALAGQPYPVRPGWAVGGWFVPILAFFRPKEIANAIWLSAEKADGQVRTERDIPAFMNWWWGLWIVMGILDNISFRLISWDSVLRDAVAGETLQNAAMRSELNQEYAGALVGAAAGLIAIPAGVLAILFVRRATERQERKAAAVSPAARAAPA